MATDAQAQIPGGPYGNEQAMATLLQGQVPGGPFVNATLVTEAEGGGDTVRAIVAMRTMMR
jgi:hypothetical protein